jgi:uncharacterized protein (TIGR02145 family)
MTCYSNLNQSYAYIICIDKNIIMKIIMKNTCLVLLAGLLFSIFIGCQKQNEMTVIVPVGTNAAVPTVTITAVTNITPTTAVSGGVIKSDGGAFVTSRGISWSTRQYPTTSDSIIADHSGGTGSFTSSLTGLTPGATYYLRAYAINAAGTDYSSQESFNTLSPLLNTATISAVTITSASSGGYIGGDGGSAVTARGVCWSTNHTPTIADSNTTDGSGGGSFTSLIKGLTPNTVYYVRAYATNNAGTTYGNELSFQTAALAPIIFNPTLTYGTVTDIEGNVYKTIQIGTQTWMAENLKTTKYRNGDPIAYSPITSNVDILNQGTYCWADDDINANKATYGAFYNFYAVTESRNIAPAGWHIPTRDEVTTLVNYLGGATVAGGKLKETGTTHWRSPNTGATNESGFTALADGFRDDNTFITDHYGCYLWTSSPTGNPYLYGWIIPYNDSSVGMSSYYNYAMLSVRCVKD